MTIEQNTTYGMTTTIGGTFEDAVVRVKDAFKEQGFGTLTEIDVKATLKEKIDEDIEPYTILGMCNPHLASRAIKAEHEIGLLLPCNVLVHECGGAIHVSAQDPGIMLQVVSNEGLAGVAVEARRRIESALAAL